MKNILSLILVFFTATGFACTNFIVTRGASADGSVMITYAADSHIRYGELYYRPGGVHEAGEKVALRDRGTHKLLGEIPQAPVTYTVIGFMNEHQVAMGETTFGGRPELTDTTGLIDYGSLMFLALQRSRTAREAIATIARLVEEYGYYSSGESFSISDQNEAWIMEMIGKGSPAIPGRVSGAVWVAVRIPDGYVSAHANHARITGFPLADGKKSLSSLQLDRIHQPETEVVYAHDVISFARERGYYSGKDSEFSFSDVYAPLDFGALRFCEMRVWSFFSQVAGGMEGYLDYAAGDKTRDRMPLYVKPLRKLTPADLMKGMRDHFTGTPFDLRTDFGAGPHALPYRWRPLTFQVDGKEYFHERSAATQQTGFSFVAQSRHWLPDPIGGIFWFGVDDANTSVYVPMYCGMANPPPGFAEGHGDMLTYADDAAFWVFNRVAHFAYLWYDRVIPDIQKLQQQFETRFAQRTPAIDKAALALYEADPGLCREFLTTYSCNAAEEVVSRWKELGNFLLVKYLDGNVKQEKEGQFLRNPHGYPLPPAHPGYPQWWLKKLTEETGERFRVK